MTLPEIPSVDECVDRMMRSRPGCIVQLLEHGRFGHPGESCGGPLNPNVSIDTKGVRVDRPTARQWELALRWHMFCREHGYPRGDSTGYPPRPNAAGRPPTILITWAQLHARFELAAAGQDKLF